MRVDNIRDLDRKIAKIEAGRKQTNIGQIKEIRKIIEDLIYVNPKIIAMMNTNARRRANRALKKKGRKK